MNNVSHSKKKLYIYMCVCDKYQTLYNGSAYWPLSVHVTFNDLLFQGHSSFKQSQNSVAIYMHFGEVLPHLVLSLYGFQIHGLIIFNTHEKCVLWRVTKTLTLQFSHRP